MSIQQAYNQWSSSYDTDANRTRDLDQSVVKAVLAGQCFPATLEIGCGTGKNTPFYARISQRLVSVDFSPGMLKTTQSKLPRNTTRFVLNDINQTWPFHDQSFNLVAFNLVLEHIADLGFIFGQAARILSPGGRIFIDELHPFRQYLGKKAVYSDGQSTREVDAFVHDISDFIQAAETHQFSMIKLQEWWHARDANKPPRLISFVFALD